MEREDKRRLNSADILLIISTGQLKESRDFPGFEVGYFSRSIKERPTVDGKIKRQIIPINIGAKPPSAVLDIQGVVIRKEDLLNFELDPGDLSSEENFLEKLPENNAFRKLLRRLREILAGVSQIQLTDEELERLNENINECASRLYKKIFAYLRGRICVQFVPERKLVIRTALPPLPADQDSILPGSTVEFVGQSFDLFGLPERPGLLEWPVFMSQIDRAEIATQWKEGIGNLVGAAISRVPSDNYYFVSSLSGRRFVCSFRYTECTTAAKKRFISIS